MTTKTGVRASSAAALAFSAMLALSACGGGDDAAANGGSPAEDVGDNSEAQGVYISHSENSEEILAIQGKDIAIMGYAGDTCDDFKAFFDKAEAGDFSGVNEDSVGTLNDSQSQMMFGSDTGYDPKPVSVNSPDTGYITVGNDGDYFVPKDSDEGKQAFDVWRNAQCG